MGFIPGHMGWGNILCAALLWRVIMAALAVVVLIAFVIFGGTLAALIHQASTSR